MRMNAALKMLILMVIGGTIYWGVEMLWRGYSHISMFILGGICFVIVGLINEFFPWDMSLIKQSVIGACLITAAEFVTGLIVNVWLGLNVWDYSNLPFNVMGQICLLFFFAWIVLAGVAIVLDDIVRWGLFGEEKPHYSFWSK